MPARWPNLKRGSVHERCVRGDRGGLQTVGDGDVGIGGGAGSHHGRWGYRTATAPPPTLTKTVIVAGDSVGVTGAGCVAGTQVQIQLDTVTLVTATSTASGTYTALLVVPKAVAPGTHNVTAVCTGPNGTLTTFNATLTVSPTATTGFSLRPPLVAAIILLMLGGFCLVARNRWRPQPAKVRSR